MPTNPESNAQIIQTDADGRRNVTVRRRRKLTPFEVRALLRVSCGMKPEQSVPVAITEIRGIEGVVS